MRTAIKAARKRSTKVRKNGTHAAAAKMVVPLAYNSMQRRRQAQSSNWLMPSIAAITPTYVEQTNRAASAGNHVQQWELYELMLKNWPELTQCYSELIEGVLRQKLIFEPYCEEDEKPTPSAIERSTVISMAFDKMAPDAEDGSNGIEGTIRDILDAWFRSVSVLEIRWWPQAIDTSVGTIMAPKCTHWLSPTSYGFDDYGVLGLQKGDTNNQPTTFQARKNELESFSTYPNQFLIAMHKATAGPMLAGALLMPLAWWWVAANFSSDWLLNLAQVFGLPFRWATYAAGAPEETINAICNMLQNMGSAGWAAFPEGTTMEIKEGGSKGGDHSPQGELLDRADRYARSLILGQTMTGTHGTTGKGGGQAFGQVESHVKADRIDAAGKFAAEVINRQFIPAICALNYGDTDECPSVRFLEDEESGLVDAQRDQILANTGLEIGVNFLRKKYGIPEPAEDEDTIGGAPTVTQSNPFAPMSSPAGPGKPPAKPPDEQPKQDMAAKLERISAIEDEQIFATELERLADQLVVNRTLEMLAVNEPPPTPQRVGKSWHSRPFITKNAADDFASKHPGTWVEEAMSGGKPNGWSVKFEA